MVPFLSGVRRLLELSSFSSWAGMSSPAVAADGLRCLSVAEDRCKAKSWSLPHHGLCPSFCACLPCLDPEIPLPRMLREKDVTCAFPPAFFFF